MLQPLSYISDSMEGVYPEMNRVNRKAFTFFFLIIELVIYGVFLWIDLFCPDFSSYSSGIKYFGIVLCFFYILISYWYLKSNLNDEKRKENLSCIGEIQDSKLMVVIVTGTLLADWCILLHDYYVLGVSFFVIVQLLYLYRISLLMKVHFGSNLIIFVIIVTIFILIDCRIDSLFLLSTFYGVGIVLNNLRGMCYLKEHGMKRNKETFFFLGLFLFLLCDISVAIYNMGMYLSVNHEFFDFLYGMAKNFMWIFYLPSQVLISLSVPIAAIDRKEVHTYGA